jgi:hypothetical protein
MHTALCLKELEMNTLALQKINEAIKLKNRCAVEEANEILADFHWHHPIKFMEFFAQEGLESYDWLVDESISCTISQFNLANICEALNEYDSMDTLLESASAAGHVYATLKLGNRVIEHDKKRGAELIGKVAQCISTNRVEGKYALTVLVDFADDPEVCQACCGACGATSGLKKCKGCMCARFCNNECSLKMWPVHKKFCGGF